MFVHTLKEPAGLSSHNGAGEMLRWVFGLSALFHWAAGGHSNVPLSRLAFFRTPHILLSHPLLHCLQRLVAVPVMKAGAGYHLVII
jgi:hypothetical protein